MSDMSLTDEIDQTLQQMDLLVERYEAVQDQAAALERLAYLHALAQHLAAELAGLRAAAAGWNAATGSTGGQDIWERTCAELRSRQPAALRAPGRALSAGSLDLLHVVEYTGAAIALVQERRAALCPEPLERQHGALTARDAAM